MGNLEKAGVGVVVALLLVIIAVALSADTDKPGDGDNDNSGTNSNEASLANSKGENGLNGSRVYRGSIGGAEVPYKERQGQGGERPVRVNSSENGSLEGLQPGGAEKPASLSKKGIVDLDAPELGPLGDKVLDPIESQGGEENSNAAAGVAKPPLNDNPAAGSVNDGSWPREVTVTSGQMLWNIAEEHYGSGLAAQMVRRIQDLNGITDARQLQVGQLLKLPPPAKASESVKKPSGATSTGSGENSGVATRRQPDVPTLPWEPGGPSYVTPQAAGSGFYVVKAGDSLSKIAETQLGSITEMERLMKLNGITDPNKLFVGQKLRLPAAAKSTNK